MSTYNELGLELVKACGKHDTLAIQAVIDNGADIYYKNGLPLNEFLQRLKADIHPLQLVLDNLRVFHEAGVNLRENSENVLQTFLSWNSSEIFNFLLNDVKSRPENLNHTEFAHMMHTQLSPESVMLLLRDHETFQDIILNTNVLEAFSKFMPKVLDWLLPRLSSCANDTNLALINSSVLTLPNSDFLRLLKATEAPAASLSSVYVSVFQSSISNYNVLHDYGAIPSISALKTLVTRGNGLLLSRVLKDFPDMFRKNLTRLMLSSNSDIISKQLFDFHPPEASVAVCESLEKLFPLLSSPIHDDFSAELLDYYAENLDVWPVDSSYRIFGNYLQQLDFVNANKIVQLNDDAVGHEPTKLRHEIQQSVSRLFYSLHTLRLSDLVSCLDFLATQFNSKTLKCAISSTFNAFLADSPVYWNEASSMPSAITAEKHAVFSTLICMHAEDKIDLPRSLQTYFRNHYVPSGCTKEAEDNLELLDWSLRFSCLKQFLDTSQVDLTIPVLEFLLKYSSPEILSALDSGIIETSDDLLVLSPQLLTTTSRRI